MKKIFSFLIVMMLVASSLFAVADTYDNTVYVRETSTLLIYYGTVTFTTSDSISNHYTQFFEISDCNQYPAYIWATCTNVAGTEDVNILPHYSVNTDTSIVSSLNSGIAIDQLTATTMQADTMTVHTGVYETRFAGSRFCRLNLDGQTGNPVTTVSWWVILRKTHPDKPCSKQILNHKV